ncbi:Riboflavin synthase [Lactococcus piscium]|uniref:riboflavin synthase n=1 Tax=Pseudolactococcus carnosus TaxID=2749961 RepID=UPI000BD59598|nr:riboflavin synthase [Lactococcus carnosus]MCJ2001581.1 riboflavin synthase [Lactococcus carnosus]SOB47948.1 Riboflavin synthase [Lactococcus piscium]
MFTGIVEEVGKVIGMKHGSKSVNLTVAASLIFSDLGIGDSVSTNGVCLTVTHISGNTFTADVAHESLNRSTLGVLKLQSSVNLERAMSACGRFGGHIVTGHIDGSGVIQAVKADDIAIWYTIATSSRIMAYIVEKGSITIDGISLTVATVTDKTFSVSVIPHTASQTTLRDRKVGDTVNLENDIVGKYIEKLICLPQETASTTKLSMEKIAQYGF